jgi:type I restriction-modification system DNA methylase subunit
VNVRSELERYGVNRKNIRDLSAPSPDVLDYLDLVDLDGDEELRPDGVIESSHRPILYYLNATHLAEAPDSADERIRNLSRNVACRGERAYLAIVKPGLLEVTPVSLEDKAPSWRIFEADSTDAINFFTNLVHANVPDGDLGDPNLVFDEMLNLLRAGVDRIRNQIGKENTLSLIGRALFFRFLCDREIVTEDDIQKVCKTADSIKACFDNAENAYRTSRWLDETFNGDFLPFKDRRSKGGTRKFFEDLNDSKIVYQNLSAIVRKHEPVGADGYQHQFDWATFDFAHVPVGLLSQVYEAFSWKWEEEESGATSVHYTPRNIAKTIVDEVFDGLENAHQARILDPACGAGVFLVLAFRRLYREHWQASGERPDTKLIRKILEKQLCGFDISDSALRLAALSLYLTAIELDPKPVPPEKLRFNVLDDLVLFNFREEGDAESGPVIGSLGEHVDRSFDNAFDLVISNPPWTRIRDNAVLANQLNEASKRVVSSFDKEAAEEYQNPDSVPDLPFLWRSTEWCKSGGRMAMALPSRMLFKDGGISTFARKTLFQHVKFTGIVNCSNVRKTNVWPEMDQPFMLVFASNEPVKQADEFWFICPQADFQGNRVGELRIDPDSLTIVPIAAIEKEDWVLKAATVGTSLDVELVKSIKRNVSTTLGAYWEEFGLASSLGYKKAGSQHDASALKGLPDVSQPKSSTFSFVAKAENYEAFSRDTLHRPRLLRPPLDELAVYRSPLVIIKQSLSTDREEGVATLSTLDAVYNQSYYGYSAASHNSDLLLARYLQLFVHSRIWLYYALCTSAKVGVERPYFYKADLDSTPFVPVEELSKDQVELIETLASRLADWDSGVFADIDSFFARLFKMSKQDIEVVVDTLTVRDPNDELGKRGSKQTSGTEAEQFAKRVKQLLRPFAKRINVELEVQLLATSDGAYRFMEIRDSARKQLVETTLNAAAVELATQTGVSRIVEMENGHITVGILNQYRYWTPSRARLLAADVLREYFSAFEGVQ